MLGATQDTINILFFIKKQNTLKDTANFKLFVQGWFFFFSLFVKELNQTNEKLQQEVDDKVFNFFTFVIEQQCVVVMTRMDFICKRYSIS